MKLQFESFGANFRILDPFKDFSEENHFVEVRKDPLLGDTSIYNPYLKDKARFFFGENDPELIKNLVEESAKTCIFCEPRVEKNTARYPSDIAPSGRIKVGEAVLFANLFSVGKYHPVVSLCKAHFLKLSEFSPAAIRNGLKAAQIFLNSVYSHDTSVPFATVNANYLLPAGASLVHPHLQMLVTPVAYSYHARLVSACRFYYQQTGSSYYSDLINEEKKIGSRYIIQKGRWHWIAAFSPTGSNEVNAIHEEESDFAYLSEQDIDDLSYGISRVLAFYESLGYLSFNYALFSVKRSSSEVGFRCFIKIINRQNLYSNYRNDDYFLQKLLQSELIIDLPEEQAEKLRGFL